jgi:hypothetical protein
MEGSSGRAGELVPFARVKQPVFGDQKDLSAASQSGALLTCSKFFSVPSV